MTAGYYEDKYFRRAGRRPLPRLHLRGPGAAARAADLLGRVVPEVARAYGLAGAKILVYPTAIGSEPDHPDFDTQPLWQQVIVGNGIANGLFMVVPNRYGTEGLITFYGSSFISDPYGRMLVQAPRDEAACSSPTSTLRRARTGSTCSRSCDPPPRHLRLAHRAGATPTTAGGLRGGARVTGLADAARRGPPRAHLDGVARRRATPSATPRRRPTRRAPRGQRSPTRWARFEPVTVVVDPADVDVARRWLDRGRSAGTVDLLEAPLDDAWMRDIGPTFVVADAGALGAVDWVFNGWGAQAWAKWDRTPRSAPFVAERAGAARIASDLVNEGGGIHVDGLGTVLVTETVQLDPAATPG